MGPDEAISLADRALTVTLTMALPILVVGLVVGVLISIVQAVTQIQEQTLSFVPKLLAVAAVMVVLGPWMADIMTQYTRDLWTSIPQVVNK